MDGIAEAASPRAPHDTSGQGAVLARGTFFNSLAFAASNLRGIFMLLVARLLGSAVLGTFGLAWATMDLLSKFSTLGLDYSAIAFIAKSEAAGDRQASRQVMKTALTISIVSSLALAFFGFWFVWVIGPRFGQRPELVRATAAMLLALPGITLYRVSNALSRGMGVMHHDIYSRGLTESLGTAAALLVALLIGFKQLAPEVAAICGTLASGLVAFALARRLFPRDRRPAHAEPGHLSSQLIRASAPIALYDLLNLSIMQIDLIMLGCFVGRAPGVTLETLGIYAAAVELAGGLRKVSQAFTPIFTPVVAGHFSRSRMREAEESYAYLARWMLALLLPAIAVLALAGGSIMTIFGPAFQCGGLWVVIIAVACAVNAFFSLSEVILMVERPHINLINSSIALTVAVGANLLLIPALGPLGAALGMLAPYCVAGLLRGFEISYLLHWRWPWRALVKPWFAALLPLPFAAVLRASFGGTFWELSAAGLYVAGYFIAWRIIGLDRSDRALLDRLLHRGRNRAAAAAPLNSAS